MNYTLINIVFLAIIAIGYAIRRPQIEWRRLGITLAVLCLLTLIFDNVIIALHIVAYHPEHILGLRLGLVPIEDFAYSLAAVLLIPLLWGTDNDA